MALSVMEGRSHSASPCPNPLQCPVRRWSGRPPMVTDRSESGHRGRWAGLARDGPPVTSLPVRARVGDGFAWRRRAGGVRRVAGRVRPVGASARAGAVTDRFDGAPSRRRGRRAARTAGGLPPLPRGPDAALPRPRRPSTTRPRPRRPSRDRAEPTPNPPHKRERVGTVSPTTAPDRRRPSARARGLASALPRLRGQPTVGSTCHRRPVRRLPRLRESPPVPGRPSSGTSRGACRG